LIRGALIPNLSNEIAIYLLVQVELGIFPNVTEGIRKWMTLI
jgi:hypothetical protein